MNNPLSPVEALRRERDRVVGFPGMDEFGAYYAQMRCVHVAALELALADAELAEFLNTPAAEHFSREMKKGGRIGDCTNLINEHARLHVVRDAARTKLYEALQR